MVRRLRQQVERLGPPRARRLALGLILVVSAVLQFYRLDDWQSFSDDQALQMNLMHGLLIDHHLPTFGMALSVGQAHMGPLFYYMLALPLWLGSLNPTAGVAMIGLFQVATVYLIYRLCALVGAPWAGLCAAGLYATSGLVVYWSRFLWPNIAPFFVVLALYALVAIALGRRRHIVTLAGSLAVAAQMQPTAVLLIPVAVLWLLVWRPSLSLRQIGASAGLVALLFVPSIVYDLTHNFVETRAWLHYGTTVQPGAAPRNGLARGLQELEQFAWHAVGFRTRSRVDLLLGLAAFAVAAMATGVAGRPRAVLARLLALWTAIYLLAFALYRGALHPHYVEPLYPLPFLAIGLLFDLLVTMPSLRRVAVGRLTRRWQRVQAPATAALYAGTAVVVLGLAAANVRHLWDDRFGLEAFQLDSPGDLAGNRLMLGEMRRAAALIAHSAGATPYSLLLAVRDGAGGGFSYLQRQTGAPPSSRLEPLQYLIVEPADRPPWLWPEATRLRWSQDSGGFIRLPHLLIWQLRPTDVRTGDRAISWQSEADTSGEATAIAVPAAGNGRVVAAFIGGVATWTPGGRWRRAVWPAGPNGRAVVTALAWSPACPRRLYAATLDGILTSTDGGSTWRPTRGQPASREALALLADAHHCGVVLAGTRAGIARSQDGGVHWRTATLGGRRLAVHALAASPATAAIYAGTSDGVWMSTDGGNTWPRPHQRDEPRPAQSVLPQPDGSTLLLAGSGGGALFSGDNGATWAPRSGGLRALVYALLSVNGRATRLAGADAGLYISYDTGRQWRLTALSASVKALVHGSGHTIYAASSAGIYRSTDDGTTWGRL